MRALGSILDAYVSPTGTIWYRNDEPWFDFAVRVCNTISVEDREATGQTFPSAVLIALGYAKITNDVGQEPYYVEVQEEITPEQKRSVTGALDFLARLNSHRTGSDRSNLTRLLGEIRHGLDFPTKP